MNVTASDISLRPFTLSDVEDYLMFCKDDEVNQYCAYKTIHTIQDGLEELEECVIPHPWHRAICLRDNRPIGEVILEQEEGFKNKCRGIIAYTLAKKYWGKGIGTLAVKLAVSTMFREFQDLERIEAHIVVENVRCQRLAEKVGFLKEGVLRKNMFAKDRIRDMFLYSILRTDLEEYNVLSATDSFENFRI
ncbi:hypothetical protein AQUCO_01700508v1 [Aquilegia coerulea]|uniref:N-acetyltransferase domain-containing protein n=1 Tax=Aquilegia coerulea TaxID=218851 RepID=A0A2G5DN90_AQUCA|nr:hypothetical protein AQUCO_01700508v1 [Aquilegia coerulea]